MNVLCARQGPGDVSGEIRVNGHPRNKFFPRVIGYCEQMDIHQERSTVRESIEFSAMLRLDGSAERKRATVEQVLETLDLKQLENHLVGGLSAEAMKRVTIGVEMAASPSILFLVGLQPFLCAMSLLASLQGHEKSPILCLTYECCVRFSCHCLL